MALVSVCQGTIAVAFGLKIRWRNHDSLTFQSISLPPPIETKDRQTLDKSYKCTNIITSMCFSEDGQYLCAMTSGKQLCILNTVEFNVIHHSMLLRAASKIRFSTDSQYLLVADKTGDALIYETQHMDKGGRKLLNHLSLLIDVLLSRNKKYVITCDRDEKIRVSCYPNTYTIESFCMGHKEFITSIDFLPHDEKYLISSSGDGTLKIWDYLVGKEMCTVDVNETLFNSDVIENFQNMMKKEDVEVDCLPISHTSCCKYDKNSSLIAVSLYLYRTIMIYKIEGDCSKFKFDMFHKVNLHNDPTSFHLTRDKFWICFQKNGIELRESSLKQSEENDVKVHAFPFDEEEKPVDIGLNLIGSVKDSSILVLYKRKFDNLGDYQRRKKQRLEGNPK